jgi:hypothetical protein
MPLEQLPQAPVTNHVFRQDTAQIHPYTKKVFSAKEIQQEFIRGFGI